MVLKVLSTEICDLIESSDFEREYHDFEGAVE